MASAEYLLLNNNASAVTTVGDWGRYPSSPGNYRSPSYLLSYVANASISVTFSGTCIWYYSDQNNDHGAYTIKIDNGTPIAKSSFSGTLQDPSLLYSSPPLSEGEHVFTLTNSENKGLGAAYFIYRPLGLPTPAECSAPTSTPAAFTGPGPAENDVVINGAHPSLFYAPAAQWESIGDYRLSYSKGASVKFQFSGTDLWMRSDRNWDHGSFDIVVDDHPATRVDSFSPIHEPDVLLYGLTDLTSGRHAVKLTNQEEGKALGIANFVFRGSVLSEQTGELSTPAAPVATSSEPPPTGQPAFSPPQSRGLPAGVYVGIVLGCAALCLLCGLIFFIFRQRRLDRQAAMSPSMAAHPFAFAPATQRSPLSSHAHSPMHAFPSPVSPAAEPVYYSR
ncbi:hypothetical protein AURDEDRAFT_115462 [Auricularia subglabra TFB-10046 SS5]|uniref:Carbohydrate esterase 2 N-terminal domain-containing protein n=1 Tax=Auricularia subglabra (strain TFB-10046 / SS5) TaxID=717982 RepID=J0WX81_AURST|nr:hypothetical protein AURDEDRAFT_115462 [Auricularia subglabra TFB-10046 SS5]